MIPLQVLGCGESLQKRVVYRYYTDDCGCGRVFWDDAIDDPRLVFEILDREGSLEGWLKIYYESKEA
jgi:hypothetical protein